MADSLVEGFSFDESGLKQGNDAELGDAGAGLKRDGCGGEVGEDHFELAAVAGINDAGEGVQAAQGKRGAIENQAAKIRREANSHASGDGEGLAGSEGVGGERMEVGGEIAVGAGVGVARELGVGVQALDLNLGHTLSLEAWHRSRQIRIWV